MTNGRRREHDESRLGSILAVIGCLGLLGITFTVGFYSGRLLGRTGTGSPAAPVQASASPAPRAAGIGAAPVVPPALTFYQELTAPLPPPAPKVAGAEPRRSPERPEPAARAEDRALKGDKRAAGAPPRPAAQSPTSRFTVQIAAYNARASAEALRSTMSAAGHQAYIVENNGPPGVPRYRVRVGSYPTREAAIAAASRLPVAGARYVTSR